jgi:hypothetical protein
MEWIKVNSPDELSVGTRVCLGASTQFQGSMGPIMDIEYTDDSDRCIIQVYLEDKTYNWWVLWSAVTKEQEYDFPVI